MDSVFPLRKDFNFYNLLVRLVKPYRFRGLLALGVSIDVIKTITYSAPAKVILSGEHAVVYGKPALVSAIDKRLRFSIWPGDDWSRRKSSLAGVFCTIEDFLIKKMKIPVKAFNFQIDSDIPVGRGLGSSAALSVALSGAYYKFLFNKEADKNLINDLAYQAERNFHNNPSGVDNTASCFGGLIFYRREFEFLKKISILDFKIPKKIEENLFLIDSGKPVETTSQMVELVGKRNSNKPYFIEQIFNNIEKVTKKMVLAIVKEDKAWFKQCLFDNQILLEMLGVVSDKIKKLLRKLERYGVGKITGAGGQQSGSGYILFFSEHEERLAKYLKAKKINYFKFKQDSQGVKPVKHN